MRALRPLVVLCSLAAVAGAVHCAVNRRHLTHLGPRPERVAARVSVLVPARDEAATIATLVADLRAQQGLDDAEFLILDDDSADDTAERARRAAAGDPRITVLSSDESPPPGWLGKPYACHRLAAAASGDTLVFLDADVRVVPGAVAAAVAERERLGVDLLSAWPRQRALTPLARLVQPLQQWSWLTTLPLDVARRSPRPSMAAANGQFLVVGAAGDAAAGGHGAVAGEVLEDIALARAVKRAGASADITDASAVAHCLMYETDAGLLAGYRKSLWAAFGGPGGSVAATAMLALVGCLPVAYAVAGRHRPTRAIAAAGYAAAVVNRVIAARATGSTAWPSAFAHPLALVVLAVLTADSARRHRTGSLTWRGRPVTPAVRA